MKIDLKYCDTIINPEPLDTIYTKLFIGNIQGGEFLFNKTIKKNALFKLDAKAEKNFDYQNYLSAQGQMELGYLYKDIWQELSLSVAEQKRSERYYNYWQITYQPVLFTNIGTLTLDNKIRNARYLDKEHNNFTLLRSIINYNKTSIIGIINAEVMLMSQVANSSSPLTNLSAGLNDLILISDKLYLQPTFDYDFSNRSLSFQNTLGFIIGKLITNLEIKHNTYEKIGFDSIYSNVFPYLTNENLTYPIYPWYFNLSFQWQDFKLTSYYQKFNSHLNWAKQDSWIQPEVTNRSLNQLGINFSGKYKLLENYFDIALIYNPGNLIPKYQISDSLLIQFKQWELMSEISVRGNRIWYGQTLPEYTIITMQFSYQWRLLKIFARADNLLNNKYEILPNYFEQGRKYCIGFELLK